jgi:hypothetical protein
LMLAVGISCFTKGTRSSIMQADRESKTGRKTYFSP